MRPQYCRRFCYYPLALVLLDAAAATPTPATRPPPCCVPDRAANSGVPGGLT
jgi:hypothetical protein